MRCAAVCTSPLHTSLEVNSRYVKACRSLTAAANSSDACRGDSRTTFITELAVLSDSRRTRLISKQASCCKPIAQRFWFMFSGCRLLTVCELTCRSLLHARTKVGSPESLFADIWCLSGKPSISNRGPLCHFCAPAQIGNYFFRASPELLIEALSPFNVAMHRFLRTSSKWVPL